MFSIKLLQGRAGSNDFGKGHLGVGRFLKQLQLGQLLQHNGSQERLRPMLCLIEASLAAVGAEAWAVTSALQGLAAHLLVHPLHLVGRTRLMCAAAAAALPAPQPGTAAAASAVCWPAPNPANRCWQFCRSASHGIATG